MEQVVPNAQIMASSRISLNGFTFLLARVNSRWELPTNQIEG
jgi:hypothetical protein